jgi:hypothetical protein
MAGLDGSKGQQLLEGAVRRMRALTGYDRVTLIADGMRAESSRGSFDAALAPGVELPPMVSNREGEGVGVYPRRASDTSLDQALMLAPTDGAEAQLSTEGVRACLTIPFESEGVRGYFRCDSRTPRKPNFELHAAAELFAQFFALRLQIDGMNSGGSAAE